MWSQALFLQLGFLIISLIMRYLILEIITPSKTIEVINKIEKEFSMKANIEYVQRNSEVQITNADCTKSKLLLKYQPKICINKGLNLFFKWFREYHDV